jgi:tetratricopeptide (TPR) repeat protein
MPGRFSNLEFHQPRRAAAEQATSATQEADPAKHNRQQADDAYRWGRFEDALRLYTRALKENRHLIPAWVGQVQMLVQLGEYHEARVWSGKALELFRGHGDLLAAQAQSLIRLSDPAKALGLSDAAIAAEGESPWRWQVRGEVLLARRERFAADCFERAVQHPLADWFDHVVVGRVYLYYRKLTTALHYLRTAVELEPTHAYPWLVMGQCQAALGMRGQAETSFSHALERKPTWAEAQSALETLDRAVGWPRRLLGPLRFWRRG